MVELQSRHSSTQLVKTDLVKRGLELARIVEAEIQSYPDTGGVSEVSVKDSGLLLPEPVLTQGDSWAQVWLKRGFNKYRQGNYLGAINNFQLALKKDPDLVDGHNGLGSCYYKLQDYHLAAVSYQQALSLSLEHPQISCNLASALHHLDDLDAAVDIYQQVLQAVPNCGSAYYGLGVTRSKQNNRNEAFRAFQQAIVLMPDHAPSYYGLGLIQFRQGAVRAASEAFAEAMLIDPIYKVAYQKLIDILDNSSSPA